jgi:hypothetical protein
LSLTLFVVALRNLGTARTGAYFSLAPFIGALLAAALGAPVTVPLLIAGLFMGFGVWLHLTERHSHKHKHLPTEHEHSHTHDIYHQHVHRSIGVVMSLIPTSIRTNRSSTRIRIFPTYIIDTSSIEINADQSIHF